jgi:glycerol uptake facilitator-like aquaporin
MFISAAFSDPVKWSQLPAYYIGEFAGGILGGLGYLAAARTRVEPSAPAQRSPQLTEEVPA